MEGNGEDEKQPGSDRNLLPNLLYLTRAVCETPGAGIQWEFGGSLLNYSTPLNSSKELRQYFCCKSVAFNKFTRFFMAGVCPWQRGWNEMVLRVPFHPKHSVILFPWSKIAGRGFVVGTSRSRHQNPSQEERGCPEVAFHSCLQKQARSIPRVSLSRQESPNKPHYLISP